jgi:hypothetical protein
MIRHAREPLLCPDGKWIQIPDDAVVENYGNPTGDAVVWYTEFKDAVFIRCFVHGGGL